MIYITIARADTTHNGHIKYLPIGIFRRYSEFDEEIILKQQSLSHLFDMKYILEINQDLKTRNKILVGRYILR